MLKGHLFISSVCVLRNEELTNDTTLNFYTPTENKLVY